MAFRPPANREALRLYREVLRTAKAFYWNNEQGQPWSEILAKSARAEFEAARHEKDPLVIARMLVIGQDAVMQMQDKLMEAQQAFINNIENTRNPGSRGPGGDGSRPS